MQMLLFLTPFVNDKQDIQRSTEKQQELEQQQTDLIERELTKFSSGPYLSSAVPGTKVTYSQDLLPNGTGIASLGQYHHTLSTSSALSIANASVNRTTAAPFPSTSLAYTTTIGPALGNAVSSENTSNAYQTHIASIQVRS